MSLDAITPATAVATGTSARSGAGSAAPQPAAPAPAPAPAASATAGAAAQAADVDTARRTANDVLKKNGCELAFEFDDEAGGVVARLIDTKTKEVLRQVPSREMLVIARALANDRSQGVLVRAKA